VEQNPRKARQNSRVQDFDVLYEAQFTTVAIQLYAYFGDLAEAQDVTQEAFCRAWHRWSHIGQYEDPVAWIRRVDELPGDLLSAVGVVFGPLCGI
jgi:DNA-directed RNA polymerase specialized sigma24 family protein